MFETTRAGPSEHCLTWPYRAVQTGLLGFDRLAWAGLLGLGCMSWAGLCCLLVLVSLDWTGWTGWLRPVDLPCGEVGSLWEEGDVLIVIEAAASSEPPLVRLGGSLGLPLVPLRHISDVLGFTPLEQL